MHRLVQNHFTRSVPRREKKFNYMLLLLPPTPKELSQPQVQWKFPGADHQHDTARKHDHSLVIARLTRSYSIVKT